MRRYDCGIQILKDDREGNLPGSKSTSRWMAIQGSHGHARSISWRNRCEENSLAAVLVEFVQCFGSSYVKNHQASEIHLSTW